MSSSTLRAQEFTSQLQYVEKLIGDNKLNDAARMLNNMAKTAPNDPRLFLLGSLMAEAANNPPGMLTAAQKAVDMAPGWPVATMRLAGVYMAQGQDKLAMQNAEQAIAQATQDNSLSADHLVRTASIAIRCQQYAQAALWTQQANYLDPDKPQLQHLLAEALAYNGQYEEAIVLYTALLEQDPDNTDILLDRLLAYINTTQLTLAQLDVAHLLKLDPGNDTYLYYAAMVKGETPTTQPASVVTRLFNASAAQFDQHLVGNLKYTLPRDVAQMILSWYPDKKLDLLDLGCGTGLLGAHLGPVDGVIVGVDLSGEMIAQAHRHNVYAQFNQVNVLDALHATQDSHYDVITALDVFIYVGDLTSVIPNAHRILTPGGRFVFSCEAAPSSVKTFALQSTQRYVHQQNHVQQLLTTAGFKNILLETCTLRYESGEPVLGFIASGQK
jgi:predicted TPR repeat methyltransferase